MSAWPWPFVMNGMGALLWDVMTPEQRLGFVPVWVKKEREK